MTATVSAGGARRSGAGVGRLLAATLIVPFVPAPGGAGAAEVEWTAKPTRIESGSGERERLPPRSAAGTAPPPGLTLRTDDFPLLREDGSFRAEGRRWRLAGVVLPERSRTCPTPEGRTWSCGARAWAKVAAYLVRRRLACDPPEAPASDPPAVTCRLAGVSVAARLAEAGWIEPDADAGAEVIAAHRRAVAARRGVHAERAPP